MCLPQALIRDRSLWLHVTRLPVSSTQQIHWEVESSQFLLLIAITNPKPLTGRSFSSKLMRLRDLTATPTSMVWTSPETRPAPWSRNGTHSLRLSFKLRPLMVTSSECSALLSQRRHLNRSRLHATPKLPTRSSLERRWWRLCKPLFKSHPSRNSSRSCKSYCFLHYIFNY